MGAVKLVPHLEQPPLVSVRVLNLRGSLQHLHHKLWVRGARAVLKVDPHAPQHVLGAAEGAAERAVRYVDSRTLGLGELELLWLFLHESVWMKVAHESLVVCLQLLGFDIEALVLDPQQLKVVAGRRGRLDMPALAAEESLSTPSRLACVVALPTLLTLLNRHGARRFAGSARILRGCTGVRATIDDGWRAWPSGCPAAAHSSRHGTNRE
mmetsp:Transcript_7/g.13  ORF Transcript_7/g.13 Transcript_7/m.13 type:complete len:210 (-) Transcript_7:140-769(-)